MKTKEEILIEEMWWGALDGGGIYDAMDEYAKEVAITYAHWLLKRVFPISASTKEPPPEAEQLFNLFIKEKKQP